jgi:hypothetical protein
MVRFLAKRCPESVFPRAVCHTLDGNAQAEPVNRYQDHKFCYYKIATRQILLFDSQIIIMQSVGQML